MASKESEAIGKEPTANDLDQLRDILYGHQARSTDDRLNRLERELDSTRQQLLDTFSEQLASLRDASQEQMAKLRKELIESNNQQSEQLLAARTDIESKMSQQASDQETKNANVSSAIEELSTNFDQNLKQAQKELRELIDNFGSEFRDRLHTYKEESQKQDDDLRMEFMALGAWLDDKKASRHDMGEMLMEMGQVLQQEKESSLDEPKKE